jgi:hypothetical protein
MEPIGFKGRAWPAEGLAGGEKSAKSFIFGRFSGHFALTHGLKPL